MGAQAFNGLRDFDDNLTTLIVHKSTGDSARRRERQRYSTSVAKPLEPKSTSSALCRPSNLIAHGQGHLPWAAGALQLARTAAGPHAQHTLQGGLCGAVLSSSLP